jgi:hypothetical protein
MSFLPQLTATPNDDSPYYNPGMAETFSWIPINGANRPLFAKATYDITNAQALGQNGFIFTDNNVQVNGNFTTIQVVSATKFTGLTATASTVGNLSAYELPAGYTFNGPITNYKLQYGSVFAYNA